MACGLTVIKKFSYRGNANEEWSNHYWLTGSTPADSGAWRTLFDALVAEEKKLYSSVVSVVAGYGYDSTADNAHAVWSVDLTVSPNTPVVGTYANSSTIRGPGDSSAWVRWGLDRLNTKGKRIFLRKYFHPAYLSAGGGDSVESPWQTAAATFGTFMEGGTLVGSRRVTDKLGSATVGHGASSFATTRTLKRRGKRPPT